jgi:hypothetical protein
LLQGFSQCLTLGLMVRLIKVARIVQKPMDLDESKLPSSSAHLLFEQ